MQFPPVPDEKYETLQYILEMAFKQASEGKGAIRHGEDKRWEEQISNTIQGWGLPYAQGQAVKKIVESVQYFGQQGDSAGAVDELLGSIVYLAVAIHNLAEGEKE